VTGASREPPPPGARDLCLWLAGQAAHDAGLIKRLVRDYGSFEEVVRQPRRRLAVKVRDHAGAPPGAPVRHATGIDEAVVTWADDDYPRQLDDLFDPPPALFVRGARLRGLLRALSERPTVAVVGARRPSPYGLEMAGLLGAGLARAGVNVVSGVALGVDAAAQVEAVRLLADRRGQTEADAGADAGQARRAAPAVAVAGVLGGGVRLIAPRTNARLFDAIATHGLLLSEYGWDLPPAPWRFPARNRVIAALARATVIVEGRSTSGALHTAAFALDMGRDVLAVPGEAGRPLAAAPHKLLRDGAHLCESVDDVLALLPDGPWRPSPAGDTDGGGSAWARVQGSGGVDESSPEGRVRAALERGPHTPDQLIECTSLAAQQVMAARTTLEISGGAERVVGGRYRLARGPAR